MNLTTTAIALSILGSVAEFMGVLLIADRVADIRGAASSWWAGQRKRFTTNEARLRALFPARPYLPPRFPRVVRVKGGLSITLAGSATATVSVSRGGTVEERLERHAERIDGLRDDVAELKASLPGRIREGAKDSPLGLTLVLVGIPVLLVANILSIAA